MANNALGLIETKTLSGALTVTHAATASGEVAIASVERGENGKLTVKIEGEWKAVQSAVEAGARAAEQAGELLAMHLIPKSDDGVSPILPYGRFVTRYTPEDESPVVARPETLRPAKPAAPKPKPRPKPKTPKPKRPQPPAVERAEPPVPEPKKAAEPQAVPEPKSAPEPQTAPEPLTTPEPQAVARPATATASPQTVDVTRAQLEAMPVVKLRQFARTITGLPIKGRQISMANKTQLLEAIDSVVDLR